LCWREETEASILVAAPLENGRRSTSGDGYWRRRMVAHGAVVRQGEREREKLP
jgi:hypothetical protein